MEPPRRIPDILFGSLIDYVVLASYQICVLDAKLLLYEMTMQIVNQNEYVHTRSRKPLLLRLRGGMDNPNVDDKSSEIPYLSHQKFMWTGFPCTDFQEKVMYPMENGLASMTVKGYSLLDACNQTDAGGIFGVPPRAVAPADVVAESVHRNRKAYSCIMNYISRGSWFYMNANTSPQLRQNGIHLLIAIRNFGTVPIPPRILKAREDTWARMAMESLRIPMDSPGYWKWADLVYLIGRKMNKNGNQMLDKWNEGFPSWFSAEKATIRHDDDAALLHPPTYAGIYPGAPNAANVHPLAGQPHIFYYAKKYYPDWCQKSMAVSKDAARAFVVSDAVYRVDDVDDVINLLQSHDITPETKCFACDGKGHAASQMLPDGSTLKCATKVLKDHTGTGTASKSSDRDRSQMAHMIERTASLEEQILQLSSQLQKSNLRRPRTKPQSRSAHGLTDESLDDPDDDDDDGASSFDSDASHVHDFAEALHPKIGKSKFSPRRSK